MTDFSEACLHTIVARDNPNKCPTQRGTWKFELVELRASGFLLSDGAFEIRGERTSGPGTGAKLDPRGYNTVSVAKRQLRHTAEVVCGWVKNGKIALEVVLPAS